MGNIDRPKISVIMSVYNAEQYVRQAVDSILGQTLKDFEFIIIDDGSTDASKEIIRAYGDARIRFIEQSNIGLAASLNKGILMSRAPYIARMDADDVALPARLEIQLSQLESNPEIALLGTAARVTDVHGATRFIMRHPAEDLGIRWSILFDSPFVHSSVMCRRDATVSAGLYDVLSEHVEDYELWSRLIAKYRAANLSDPLMIYRDNPEGISHLKRYKQEENSLAVSAKNISELIGETFSLERARGIRNLRYVRWSAPKAEDVIQAACDYRNLFSRFLMQYQEDMQLCSQVADTIEKEVDKAEMTACIFLVRCGSRLQGWRLFQGCLRHQRNVSLNTEFWKALFVLSFGYTLYSMIRGRFRFSRSR